MPLLLVLHELEGTPTPEGQESFSDALFGLAPDHWRLSPHATFLATGVSPAYVVRHLRRSAERAGLTPRRLVVVPVPDDMAAHGLGAEGEAWIREMRE